MVGLSDIPCVGEVVDRVSKAIVDALFRECSYLFRYKKAVDILNSKIENVNIEVDRVFSDVAAEVASGKIIKEHVLKWQEKAEKFQENAIEFSERYENRHSWRCIQCLPIPNPVSRFQLGREAVKSTKKAIKLINSGRLFLRNEIADLPEVKNLPNPNGCLQGISIKERCL